MFISRFIQGILLCLSILFFGGVAFGWQGRPWGDSWGGGFCPFLGTGAWVWPGAIMTIVFWVLIMMVLIYAIRWLMRSVDSTRSSTLSPMDILKQRFAKGEISREEFDEIKARLQ